MLTFIASLSLFILLYVCIWHIEYSLAVFMPIIMLLPNTIKILGVNVQHLALIILIVGLYLGRKKTNEILKGCDQTFKMYTIGIALLSFISMVTLSYMTMSLFLSHLIRFMLDIVIIGLLLNHLSLHHKAICIFDKCLYATTTIVALYAFYNYFSQSNPYMAYVTLVTNAEVDMSNSFQESVRGALQGRVSSTFVHPLILGQCILLVTSYILYKLNDNKILIKWLVISVLFVVSFLTGSRSSLIPIVVSIIIYLFSLEGRARHKNMLFATILFIIILIITPKSYKETISNMFWENAQSKNSEIGGSSLELREQQMESAIKILGTDIIIGRGNGYVTSYGQRHAVDMLGYESLVFRELFDNGIIGLIFFFLFYGILYIKLLRYANTKRNKYRVHSLCLSFLISGVLTGIQYGMITFYIVFYMITIHNINEEEKTNKVKLSIYNLKYA